MAKSQTKFICNGCGAEYVRWQGKCDQCGQWETLVETIISTDHSKRSTLSADRSHVTPKRLNEIEPKAHHRITTNIQEFDRVLGGGIVPGSLTLLGGDPGIGKSTLLLQALAGIAQHAANQKLLYVSGEESVEQIKLRADRLQIDTEAIVLVGTTNIATVAQLIEQEQPTLVVIDSIQTLSADEVPSGPGSVAQVKYVTEVCMHIAKTTHIPIVIIGHVTKDGGIAGPKALEHLVDAVLYLEGDRYQSFRLLRGIKNRFGKTSEVGIFEMVGEGMAEVQNPSQVFLEERLAGSSGVAISAILEGNRPLLVEIQALASRSYFGYPKRTASGYDLNRLNLIIAIIEKRFGLDLAQFDVYLNIVGGIKVKDHSIDLAVAAAIISAAKNKPLPENACIIGELGLSGEVRSVARCDVLIEEASRLKLSPIIVPHQKLLTTTKVQPARTLKAACDSLI